MSASTRTTDILPITNLSSLEFARSVQQFFYLRGGAMLLYVDHQSSFEPFKTVDKERWSYSESEEQKERIKSRRCFKDWVTNKEEQRKLETGEVQVIVRCATNHKLMSLPERAVARQKRIMKKMYLQNGTPDTMQFARRCQQISHFSNERTLWIAEDGTALSPNDFRIAAAEDSGLPPSLLPSGSSPASQEAIQIIAEQTKTNWKIMAKDAIEEHLLYRSRKNKHPELNTKLYIGDIVLVRDYLLGPKGRTGRSFKESLFQVQGFTPGKRELELWHYQKNQYFGQENIERKKTNQPLLKGKKIIIQRPSDACILIASANQMKEKIPIDIDLLSPEEPSTDNIKFDGQSPSQINLREEDEEQKPEPPTSLKISDGKVMESTEIKDIRRTSLRKKNKKK